MTETISKDGPLTGLRIIDLTRILAGPICTMNLGDMGAEIIKIEQPSKGDDTRNWGPPFIEGEAAYFLGANRSKKSVTLDLKSDKGRDILSALIQKSDVVIDNFKTGTLEGWGFSESWFKENAPQVIQCQITGYGDKGPKAGLPGYDFLLQAESGLMDITGNIDRGPAKYGVAIVDVCTGQNAAMCILAALNARHNTGKGQRIDISLFNTSLSMLVNIGSNYLVNGKRPGRFGNAHASIVPYRDFATKDTPIAIAVGNDTQFARMAKSLGHPEWAADDDYKTNAQRVANRDLLEPIINEALAAKSCDDWIEIFERDGIPCSKINAVDEALESEQAQAHDMVVEVDHPTIGPLKMLGVPYEFSETPAKPGQAPPLLGADTADVLADVLDMTTDEIAELRTKEII
ncbi:MAG: CoA transferase [Rhodospirillaceae bacterium]|nr:CoA transferase [Rhodospirillaceae bacterium]MBT4589043.1 CoA transferase [Rhodospirillaceae bacterium]MBT7268961.1 CoA transferase [Rhodospirillaceae bacterium]